MFGSVAINGMHALLLTTMDCMQDKDDKNAISHRGRALAQLRAWCEANAEQFAEECAAAAAAAEAK